MWGSGGASAFSGSGSVVFASGTNFLGGTTASSVAISSGATVSGAASITANVTNSGTILVGGPGGTGTLAITGNFTQTTGNTFALMTFGSCSGTFAGLSGLSQDGTTFTPQYNSATFTLVALAEATTEEIERPALPEQESGGRFPNLPIPESADPIGKLGNLPPRSSGTGLVVDAFFRALGQAKAVELVSDQSIELSLLSMALSLCALPYLPHGEERLKRRGLRPHAGRGV